MHSFIVCTRDPMVSQSSAFHYLSRSSPSVLETVHSNQTMFLTHAQLAPKSPSIYCENDSLPFQCHLYTLLGWWNLSCARHIHVKLTLYSQEYPHMDLSRIMGTVCILFLYTLQLIFVCNDQRVELSLFYFLVHRGIQRNLLHWYRYLPPTMICLI